MLLSIVSVVLGSAHAYLWKRLVKDTTAPGLTRRVLTVVIILLAGLLLATLNLPRLTGRPESPWVAWPGYSWLAVVVYLLLALLLIEPVRMALRGWVRAAETEKELIAVFSTPTPGVVRPEVEPEAKSDVSSAVSRRVFLARTTAVAAGAASVGLVGYGAATAFGPPQVLQVPVSLRRLDPALNGFRIAVVSDIHLGSLLGRAHTERIVRMINETEPDLVAIVGDLVDDSVAVLGRAAEPLQDLSSREGAFFVTGNHEYYVDDTAEWIREIERLGVQPLRNENTVIRRGGAAFDLAGVNDITGERISEPPDYGRALAGLDGSGPTVLLAHQPVMVSEAATRGVDLQVSGHTHGGQMWPFHYVVDQVQPTLAGLSTFQETQLYVTRGAGFWGPPVRVGAPPDITVLSLHSEA